MTPEEMQGVPHHLVGFLAPEQAFSVADFTALAGEYIQDITARGHLPLLVGGTGIMNIMLVSVTERTREIGIRKSLGAKCRDIRSQFIIEAGTTSAIGGAIGIILGILMANVLTNVIALVLGTGNDGFVAMPTAGGIGVAFGVSVAVGILFGYLPANKAAKLNPIDALRYD